MSDLPVEVVNMNVKSNALIPLALSFVARPAAHALNVVTGFVITEVNVRFLVARLVQELPATSDALKFSIVAINALEYVVKSVLRVNFVKTAALREINWWIL